MDKVFYFWLDKYFRTIGGKRILVEKIPYEDDITKSRSREYGFIKVKRKL